MYAREGMHFSAFHWHIPLCEKHRYCTVRLPRQEDFPHSDMRFLAQWIRARGGFLAQCNLPHTRSEDQEK
jgi:hypothetical protein